MVSETTHVVGLLLIGSELLSGKIRDENGPYCIRGLADVGARLGEIRVVHDDLATIAAAISDMRERYDWLLTSGGVGPTHDDITMEAVARAFGVELVQNDELQEHIDRVFGDNPDKLRVWSRMALLPAGCTLFSEPDMFWPIYRMDRVFVLPGVPQIFSRQFDAIRAVFAGSPVSTCVIYVSVGEGLVAEPLRRAADRFAEATLGSYPVWGNADFRTRLTVEAADHELVEAVAEWLVAELGQSAVHEVVYDQRVLTD